MDRVKSRAQWILNIRNTQWSHRYLIQTFKYHFRPIIPNGKRNDSDFGEQWGVF
jgi:hypothetical protein